LNPHRPFGPADFKSAASASFAIPAWVGYFKYRIWIMTGGLIWTLFGHTIRIRKGRRGGIMELQLTTEERSFVEEILLEHQRVLLHEISRSDGREFRSMLRQKELLLEAILRKVRAAQGIAA
jgi:hypothetical protein